MADNDVIYISDENSKSIGLVDWESEVHREEENQSQRLTVIYLPSLVHAFGYRNEDFPIVKSILEDNEYAMEFLADFNPQVIFDCGAHIGTAAVYFTNKYPEAQIYSVEPEVNNYKLLIYNTIFYDNIHPIRGAIWDKENKLLEVQNNGFGRAGFMMKETDVIGRDDTIVDSYTIPQLMKVANCDTIDLLKIDIEGSEKELFEGANVHDWLCKVRVLAIELHDRMKLGCSNAFFRAMSKYDWHFIISKEDLIFVRTE